MDKMRNWNEVGVPEKLLAIRDHTTSLLGYLFILTAIFGIFITVRNWNKVRIPEKVLAIFGVIVGLIGSAALLSGQIP